MKRRAPAFLCLLFAAVTSGCATASLTVCRPGQESMTVAKMLFGRDAHGRRVVTDGGWRDFLAREITPRFPDGLTAFDTAGQWRDPANGTISREASKVVMIAFRDDPTAHERLNAIAEAYKRRFAQKSVGLVVSSACVSF